MGKWSAEPPPGVRSALGLSLHVWRLVYIEDDGTATTMASDVSPWAAKWMAEELQGKTPPLWGDWI
jgi:hypothetical protein